MPEPKLDKRIYAPAAGRNKEPISQVLHKYLHVNRPGHILEIGSGTGEHIAHFASKLPFYQFQPSDKNSELFSSIEAHSMMNLNVLPPIILDAQRGTWPEGTSDAVVCINVSHISPFEATLGLLSGANNVLALGGLLFIYSPFMLNGEHTADSNLVFDEQLRGTNPEWGIRDVDRIQKEAEARGFESVAVEDMPANNKTLIFRKRS